MFLHEITESDYEEAHILIEGQASKVEPVYRDDNTYSYISDVTFRVDELIHGEQSLSIAMKQSTWDGVGLLMRRAPKY